MATNRDIQELLQLAQLEALLAGPQLQEQQLAQSGQNQRLQAALSVLGLQQQADEAQAMRAFRESEAARAGQQFTSELDFRRGEGEADRTFRATEASEGREFAGEQNFLNRAIEQARLGLEGERFDAERDFRDKSFDETRRQFDTRLGFERDTARDVAMSRDEELDLRRRGLSQQGRLGDAELATRLRVAGLDSLLGDPTMNSADRSFLVGQALPEFKPVTDAFGQRADAATIEKLLAGIIPAEASNQETMIATAPERLQEQLRAEVRRRPTGRVVEMPSKPETMEEAMAFLNLPLPNQQPERRKPTPSSPLSRIIYNY